MNNIQLFFIFLILPVLSGHAQIDAHYWTNQFGAKGLLLNGAVIASTEDETAIYYNPGAMGSGEDFALSLSFLTPSYSLLETRNFLGEGTKLKDSNFGFTSGFAAVGSRLFNNDCIRGAATTFTRSRSFVDYRSREVGPVNNEENLFFVGNLDFQRRLTERWIGVGISYQVNGYLSVGMSQFMVLHSENTNIQLGKEVFARDNPMELLFGGYSKLKYGFTSSGGMLTKFGLSFQPEKYKFGLTLTTPVYAPLFRSGFFEFAEIKRIDSNTVESLSNLSSVQVKNHKTPWAIGIGLDFSLTPTTRISFSSEYFAQIDSYTVLEDTDDPFNGLATVDFSNSVSIQSASKAVTNFALGIQKETNDGSTVIFGFRTDFNQRKAVEGFSDFAFLGTTPSVFHFSAGGLFTAWGNQLSIGVDMGIGRQKGGQQLVDFYDITQENLFNGTANFNVTSSHQSFIFILTYDFIFKKRKTPGKEKN